MIDEKALAGWGRWHKSIVIASLGYPRQPMFREYYSAYPESNGLLPAYDEEDAIKVDRVIASRLSYKQTQVLLCAFCFELTSRDAADYLKRKGFKCNKDTYLRWLDEAVLRVNES